MAIITVVGASGGQVQVTVDGSQNSTFVKQAEALSSKLSSVVDTLDVRHLTPGTNNGQAGSNQAGYGVITSAGSYNVAGNTEWLSVGSDSVAQPGSALAGWVNVDLTKDTAQNVTVLGGTEAGISFRAGSQSGTFFAGSGDNRFQGSNLNNAGNWNILTGDGNDVIDTGAGSNTVVAGAGDNTITLGTGVNYVHSDGQDTITATAGTQNITLNGASSVVQVGANSLVVDNSADGEQITVGGGSTVIGGSNGNDPTVQHTSINLAGSTGTVIGGQLNTISAAYGDFEVSNTNAANVDVSGSLTFIRGTGVTTITAGQTTIFGANGLDAVVNSTAGTSLFVANEGNETLDGASSAFGIHAFGTTTGTGNQLFIGGSASDTLVGGVGNATLQGGSGAANVFGFRDGIAGADYTISDFGSAAGNSVLLVNYGYTDADLQKVLDSASHKDGNTTVTLSDQSQITFVGVDSLNTSQFNIANNVK